MLTSSHFFGLCAVVSASNVACTAFMNTMLRLYCQT